MAFAIILKDKKLQRGQVVGHIWAKSREEANSLARFFHPCQEDQELVLQPAD
ncbi:MAG TPA: hypothetical protein VMD30_14105 [Tepidisphaeraceae bacterium]|nr:hypothetical protein [Tepidisphaeraceae bacterium]